eukprot:2683119-Karenia_brevis.AAC.1
MRKGFWRQEGSADAILRGRSPCIIGLVVPEPKPEPEFYKARALQKKWKGPAVGQSGESTSYLICTHK